ncbi:MAG: hypothetical protein ACRDT2_01755 [Natronosporangium sp.]
MTTPVSIRVEPASSRTFPRSRQNLGPLVEALHTWLAAGPPPSHLTEDWLLKHP